MRKYREIQDPVAKSRVYPIHGPVRRATVLIFDDKGTHQDFGVKPPEEMASGTDATVLIEPVIVTLLWKVKTSAEQIQDFTFDEQPTTPLSQEVLDEAKALATTNKEEL